jgi:maltose alpha-D-glucosyltransferase/alpha-amylase
MEDRVPIVDILDQTPAIPETSQWALFLRNHDELTLEMVTDEERDYMYRVYANDARARLNLGIRRRLAPLLGNDRKRIELLNLLLFSLPGTPVLYYGDEIGMGDNVFLGDRNGVRTPMQWSSDKNAGFSRATPQALYLPIVLDPEYHYEAVNVEAQQRNPNSLLWWTKQILTLRKRYKAFGRGSLRFVQADNRKVLAFLRSYESERLLIIANLSRYPQPVRLELSEFQKWVPVELFGGTSFPAITDQPYFLTLSPHAGLWFALEPASATEASVTASTRATLNVRDDWTELLKSKRRDVLENCLTDFLAASRFLRASAREVRSVQIRDAFELQSSGNPVALLVVSVNFVEGDPSDYYVPIAWAGGAAAERLEQASAGEIICRVRSGTSDTPGLLYLAHRSPEFSSALLTTIIHRRSVTGLSGELSGFTTPTLRSTGFNNDAAAAAPAFGGPELNNVITIYPDKLVLKFLRRAEVGANPDLDLCRFLTEQNFPNIAPVAGWAECHRDDGSAATVAILSRFLPGTQDGWPYTLDTLSRYFDRIRTAAHATLAPPPVDGSLSTLAETEPPESTVALLGTYLELARLLGQRTGELHRALSADVGERDFAPEPFTPFYQRSLYQSMRNLAVQTIARLRQKLTVVPQDLRADAQKVADSAPDILRRLRSVYQVGLSAQRIRCHGDLHLGQVLYTGKDFFFVDFEGEPSRPLGERRIKRSPLFDVAGMIRSFDYVAYAALLKQIDLGILQPQQLGTLEPWARFWSRRVSVVFLKAYLAAVKGSGLVPAAKEPFSVLLEAYLLEKAIAEIGYELEHRLDWLKIPIRGLLQLLSSS